MSESTAFAEFIRGRLSEKERALVGMRALVCEWPEIAANLGRTTQASCK
jgi:hypothetical protein